MVNVTSSYWRIISLLAAQSFVPKEQTQQRNLRRKKWLKVAATYPWSAQSVRKLPALRLCRLWSDPWRALPKVDFLARCSSRVSRQPPRCGGRRQADTPTGDSQWPCNGSPSMAQTDSALLINPYFAVFTPKWVRAAHMSVFDSLHDWLPPCSVGPLLPTNMWSGTSQNLLWTEGAPERGNSGRRQRLKKDQGRAHALQFMVILQRIDRQRLNL